MRAHNTFDKPEQVNPTSFADAKLTDGGFSAKLPAKSVVVLELE
jgi:alpha-L-arabinofuranosidase